MITTKKRLINRSFLLFNLVVLCTLFWGCQQEMEETQPIKKDIVQTVFATGVLEAEDRYELTVEAEGYLSEMNFEEGDIIKKGAKLAVIDNQESGINQVNNNQLYELARQNTLPNAPALRQAESSIRAARQRLVQDSLQAARYAKLWQANSVAKVEYENAALAFQNAQSDYRSAVENYNKIKREAELQLISYKANRQLSDLAQQKVEIKAQTAGKIYEKYKETGDFVSRGQAIASIGDPQDIFAKINVDESSIAKIRVGQQATVQLNTNADETLQAVVSEILPVFDEASQSFICKLTFTDSLNFSIIGTQLQTNIRIGESETALLIPRRFVNFNNEVQVKGEEEKRKIKTKIVSSEWVQVVEGIEEKTTLVVGVN